MWLLLACAPPPAAPPADASPVEAPAPPPAMAPSALLTRVSIDLRGVRPTLPEHARVASAADPYEVVDTMAAEWVDDPRFGDQVASLYADVLLTRQDTFATSAADYGLPEEAPFIQAVGEAPLQFIAQLARTDGPWTDTVTADWTVANDVLAGVWPLDYPKGATGWEVARWTDGRPAVGLLATSSMWWRYTSTDSNANRGRANTISRVFLCNDYLSHPIAFDRGLSLVDEDAVRAALTTSPACVSCHVSLDPLAANLFGFRYAYDEDPYDRARYHPEREDAYTSELGVDPGYFGQPSDGLYELGRLLASDRRFVTCPVETVYAGLLQRAATADDAEALVAHRERFLTGGLTLASLYLSVVGDERYRAAPAADPSIAARKLLRPDQLASTVEGLTGYRMTAAGWELLRTDLYGYRLLAGGVDGVNATAGPLVPTPTLLLVQERLAEAAASAVTEAEQAAAPADRRLYTRITFTETPTSSPDTFRAQVQDLALAVLGETWEADGEEVTALVRLWEADYATSHTPGQAWTVLLTALLRDPAFLVD